MRSETARQDEVGRLILAAMLAAVALAGCLPGSGPAGDAGPADLTTPAPPSDGGVPGSDLPPPPTSDLATAPGTTAYVYVGGASAQIGVYKLDRTSGALSPVATTPLPQGAAPTFLAIDPQRRWLYAANDVQSGGVSSYAIDSATGKLTHLNDVSMGSGPTHVSVDRTGKWVFAANYSTGHVASWPIQANGALGAAVDDEHPGQNAHQIVADASNKYVLVPCLGSNLVAQFVFNAQTGALTANSTPSFTVPAGSGPRHLALHPNGQWVYLEMEIASTVQALSLDGNTGRLSSLQTPQSTLAAPLAGNTGAEVQVHPSGKFVYTSNRGDDSIATFEVSSSGQLTFKGTRKTGGATPRHFSIDPSGRWLLVANQGSGNVTVLAIDAATGALSPAGGPVAFGTPEYVSVVELP